MKKHLSIVFLLALIIPSVTFASWWNPFTWKVFNKALEVKIEQPIVVQTSTPVNTITKSTKILKKTLPTSNKENIIKPTPIIQTVENIDLKIAKCKATKETSYNTAILKFNQSIDNKLKEVFASLEQQTKDTASKIYTQADINISRITNDITLTASSKSMLIEQYNNDALKQVSNLCSKQQVFWGNQKREIESSKQKGIDQINVLLSEEYTKCLTN